MAKTGRAKPQTADARVEALENLCGEAYQLLGTVGAPVEILDKLAAAADGEPIPDIEIKPVNELAFDAVAIGRTRSKRSRACSRSIEAVDRPVRRSDAPRLRRNGRAAGHARTPRRVSGR